jgi:hypothetical protein
MPATSTSMPVASPLLRRFASIMGWLCVIATLALLGPGVMTARAEGASSSSEAGPVCRAPEQVAEETVVSIGSTIEQLRAQEIARGGDSDGWVMLNNRGYNYGPQANPLDPESEQR